MRHSEKSENITQGRRSLVIASQAVGVVAVYVSFLEFVAKSGQKFIKNSQKKMRNSMQKMKNRKFIFH